MAKISELPLLASPTGREAVVAVDPDTGTSVKAPIGELVAAATQGSVDAAERQADLAAVAALTAPGVYVTIAAGLAATANGATFWAQAANGRPTLYRKVAGAARVIAELPGADSGSVTLSTFTPADGKLFTFVGMTAGSPVLNALQQLGAPTPTAFGPEDIGKAIKVAGAGVGDGAGNDLVSTIVSVQSATQITLAHPAQQTIALAGGKGAVLGTDCGPGLQAALDLTKATGAATIVIDGLFYWRGAVTRTGGSAIRLTSSDATCALMVAGNPDRTMATLANTGVTIDRAMFVGCPGAINDCRRLLDLSSSAARIVDCGIVGISVRGAAATTAALVWQTGGSLDLRRNSFGGCIGESGNAFSVVDVDDFQGFSDEGSSYIDYGGFRGHTLSKTGIGFTFAWVRVRSPRAPTASVNHGSVVRIRDCRYDEGHYLAVLVQPDLDRPLVQQVHLSGVRVNNSLLDGGTAIQVARAESVLIEQPSIGWANTPHNGIVLESCGDVVIDSPYITSGYDAPTTGKPDGLVAANVRSLTLRNAGQLARRYLTNVARVIEIEDGVGGVVPFSKFGRPTDADFRTPPTDGTMAVDLSGRRLYVRLGGVWLATAALVESADPVAPLANVSGPRGVLDGPATYRRVAASNGFDAAAHVFRDLDGFRLRARLLGVVPDALVGGVTVGGEIGLFDMQPGFAVEPSGNLYLANGEIGVVGTIALGDVVELTYDAATHLVRLLRNDQLLVEQPAHAAVRAVTARHFALNLATQGAAVELLEWSPL